MPLPKRAKYLSGSIAVASLVLLVIIYYLTGDWVIMILFIPPITHWILEKRQEKREKDY